MHMLRSSKENASALSSLGEKSYVQTVDNDLRELSETEAGVPVTPETYSRPTRGSHAVEGVGPITSFTNGLKL